MENRGADFAGRLHKVVVAVQLGARGEFLRRNAASAGCATIRRTSRSEFTRSSVALRAEIVRLDRGGFADRASGVDRAAAVGPQIADADRDRRKRVQRLAEFRQ